ncbi:CPBP family intramembrane glutamic endopeptidase [Tenacibaculum aquimarinum]|uniref:CPBP family intramembrane glutamic endopeptidase n=1 Tax=Tenacibaculum aquimarinum TaxID=2910675 RepID=UPI001F0A95EA|nr:CPBP family intramembrane glutamic endopeptidase [Tenacibaculum aquimarinum]MCH3884738.1 CPBP family intramembrane metalloprotease [Tenacibaculum aquimarinum]
MNFIQQAYKGENSWLTYVGTFLLVIFGWQLIGVLPLLAVAVMHSADMNEFSRAAENSFMGLGINSSLYLFLLIFTFAMGLLFLFIGVKYVHKRSFTSLVTSRNRIDWKRFWFGFITWGILAGLMIIVGLFITPENYTWNFKAVPFFTLLVVSLLFLPFQTSFEELLFRGYFMQSLGILVKNRWFPLIFTSVVFGLMHGANPEIDKLGYVAFVFYIGTGLLYGITTLMDEGTELALGLHAVNNIVAAFFVTTDWTVFQTDALYIDTSEPSVGWEMFFPVFVLYPLLLFVFSKKYGWTNWKENLFGKIEKPKENLQNEQYSLIEDTY